MGRTGSTGRSSGSGGERSGGGRSSSSSGRSRSVSLSKIGYSPPMNSHNHHSSHHNNHYNSHHSNFHSKPPRYRRQHHHHHGGRNSGYAVIIFIVLLIMFFIFKLVTTSAMLSSGERDITKSTIIREPLPKESVIQTNYYDDEIGWINNSTKLTTGMKNFYQKTGVQPYLYITDSLDGKTNPNNTDAEKWLNSKYDELFNDEAHTMLLFFERDGKYSMWYLNGKQAKTVMDSEAMDILMDYVELYYYNDMTEDEMFSKAYDMAAVRIMEVTRDPIPWYAYFFILLAVIIIVVVLFRIWKAKKAQQNIEDENTRAILETPLEKI